MLSIASTIDMFSLIVSKAYVRSDVMMTSSSNDDDQILFFTTIFRSISKPNFNIFDDAFMTSTSA